jgi:hypothetical protein
MDISEIISLNPDDVPEWEHRKLVDEYIKTRMDEFIPDIKKIIINYIGNDILIRHTIPYYMIPYQNIFVASYENNIMKISTNAEHCHISSSISIDIRHQTDMILVYYF